jgi:hypothetical protein
VPGARELLPCCSSVPISDAEREETWPAPLPSTTGFHPRHSSRRAHLEWLDGLSQLFDTAFVIPGTNIRFGIEAVLRLVPGIGDVVASGLSCFLLYEAHRLGVPRHIFLRMVANVAVEGVIGSVPLLGDAFDVAFRANRRNVRLLRDYLNGQR